MLEAYQIIIHNHDEQKPVIQLRYREGTKYIGTHNLNVSDVVAQDLITQEEADQVEAILRKLATNDKEKNNISIDSLSTEQYSIDVGLL